MNEHFGRKLRNRPFRRIAAATAVAVGAALLAAPGTAAAQDDPDCAALGDNPMESGISATLDAAIACDVEVRLFQRAWPYATVSVTPQGQLHLTATSDSLQEHQNFGALDPTLYEPWEETLRQVNSPWKITLPNGPTPPLFWGENAGVHFPGDNPTPVYSGTVAVYDEIAAGLDFEVDAGIATSKLRFTAADEAAWNSLATGLSVLREGSVVDSAIVDGALRFENWDYPNRASEWTTPFIARDADDVTYPISLSGSGGALTMRLPDGALETAVFPLEVSTQWAFRHHGISEWGAVTSAEPGLALYRGDGGLDEPYFEAAGETGDAVVGPYCDDLAAPDCAVEAESEAFWNFQWPLLETNAIRPSQSFTFTYPVTAAVFSVDAAEGADCAAPDLSLTGEYTPGSTWDERPSATAPAATGSCADGTAAYDVTAAMREAWDQPHRAKAVSFGMTESDTTARFDGDTARLDVYMDIVGYKFIAASRDICVHYDVGTVPAFSDSTPQYGGFLFDTWRPEALDHGVTWTATFYEGDLNPEHQPGEVVMRTEPRAAVLGSSPVYSVAEPLPDRHYEIGYEFTSGNEAFSLKVLPCSLVVDTVAPEFLDVSVPGGQRYVGEPVDLSLTVGDDNFPGSLYGLTIDCMGGAVCGADKPVHLSASNTAAYEVQLTRPFEPVMFQLKDRAGNSDYSETVTIDSTWSRNDFNGDGHQDLMAVRVSDGNLMFHAGNGNGTFEPAVSRGGGWGGMDLVMAGDLNGDGKADVLGRDGETGRLYFYSGNGAGNLGSRVQVGTGWNAMGVFTASGDFDYDGKIDLVAVKRSNGTPYLYPGRGDGTFGAAVALRSSIVYDWSQVDSLTSPGDVDNDGYDDLLVSDGRTGAYYVYLNNGTSQFHRRLTVPASLDGSGADRYTQVVGAGDVDGDNYEDLLAVDSRTGELELHSLAPDGTAVHSGKVVATGWGGNRLAAVDEERTYDYNGDGATDLIARRDSNDTTYLYTGDGLGGVLTSTSLGTGLSGMNLIETAGDLNGDGLSDLLARKASDGSLWLYPGNGAGGLGAGVRIGTGWNAMSVIISGHDFNGDGKIDVVAREASTGYLWLYSGSGTGTVGSRVQIGTGWNAMQEITALGDLDHDGIADLVAVRSSEGCMYFYGGKPTGGVKNGVKLGCGWNGMNAVTSVGDFDGDGHVDFAARRKSDGVMFLYPGNGKGNFLSAKQIGTGWNAMDLIA